MTTKLKIIIATIPEFNNYDIFSEKLNFYLSAYKSDDIELLCWGAPGENELVERYSKEQNIELTRFNVDASTNIERSLYIIDEPMVSYANGLIAFSDNQPGRVKCLIEMAEHFGLTIKIQRV